MINQILDQLENLIKQKATQFEQEHNINILQLYLKPETEIVQKIKNQLFNNELEDKYKNNLVRLLSEEFVKEQKTQDIHKLINIFSTEIQIIENLKK